MFSVESIFLLIACSLIFDFFDGFVARAVKASGSLGKELDSLADVISFGFLPGLLMFSLLDGEVLINYLRTYPLDKPTTNLYLFSFFGLFITLFSAYRLAKFNLDEDQSYYFKGLPTPANTLFIFSLYWIIDKNPESFWNNPYLLLIICIFSCIILVSNLPLLALKFKNLSWKDNYLVFSFLIICVILLIWLKIASIPIIILFYILLSILFKKKIISNGPQIT